MYTSTLKPIRNMKILQLFLMITLGASFFITLKVNPDFRYEVFTNRHLFLLCAYMWLLLIISFLFIIYDLFRYRKLNIASHELNKLAYLDDLTGIPNRYSCDLIFKMYRTSENLSDLGCALMEINNLETINAKYGYDAGSQAIQEFCQLLEQVGDTYGFVGRNSGNEYLAAIENCSEKVMKNFLEDLQRVIHDRNQKDNAVPIEIAYAYTLNSQEQSQRFSDLITITYKKLHYNKR